MVLALWYGAQGGRKVHYILAHRGVLLADPNGAVVRDHEGVVGVEIEARYAVAEQLSLLVLKQLAAEPAGRFDLRSALAVADADAFARLARAAQIATWHDQHRFCGRCGHGLERHGQDLAKVCPACELTVYPRISPCIIVLVVDGKRCLLAHNARFPAGRYSTLAGFIEAGESAEMAVAREVREEVGVEVSNIRYVASQAWPFPHSLMLGFFADYAGGELRPDGEEITEAGWFDADHLPDLPPRFAISRQLIERFLAGASA